jgi:hypothetical protein
LHSTIAEQRASCTKNEVPLTMGRRFSGAVQWWEEWQLRVLALASLFLQYFLFVAAPLRKRCIPLFQPFFSLH